MEITPPDKKLSIGELANTAGVGVETIRFYQRRGLLRVPQRLSGRSRLYDQSDIYRLWLIAQAKAMGFTLDEIKQLADYVAEGDCCAFKAQAEAKIKALTDKIKALTKARRRLQQLIGHCPPDCSGRHECLPLRLFRTPGTEARAPDSQVGHAE